MDISIHNPPAVNVYRAFQQKFDGSKWTGKAFQADSKGQNGGYCDYDIPSTGPMPQFIPEGTKKKFIKITSAKM